MKSNNPVIPISRVPQTTNRDLYQMHIDIQMYTPDLKVLLKEKIKTFQQINKYTLLDLEKEALEIRKKHIVFDNGKPKMIPGKRGSPEPVCLEGKTQETFKKEYNELMDRPVKINSNLSFFSKLIFIFKDAVFLRHVFALTK